MKLNEFKKQLNKSLGDKHINVDSNDKITKPFGYNGEEEKKKIINLMYNIAEPKKKTK